jgi:hypothetical protein
MQVEIWVIPRQLLTTGKTLYFIRQRGCVNAGRWGGDY